MRGHIYRAEAEKAREENDPQESERFHSQQRPSCTLMDRMTKDKEVRRWVFNEKDKKRDGGLPRCQTI